MNKEVKEIRVSAKSPVHSLASSIVFSVEEGKSVVLRAVGASSCNQMYKGIAVARGSLAAKGKDIFIKPGFDEVIEEGEKKTVLVAFIVVM